MGSRSTVWKTESRTNKYNKDLVILFRFLEQLQDFALRVKIEFSPLSLKY